MKQLYLLLLLLLPAAVLAQTPGSVGVGTTAPDASAALDVTATDKGALLPRLTQAQRTALPSPAPGLILYQTDGSGSSGPGFWYNSGTAAVPKWLRLTDAAGLSYDAGSGLQVGPGPVQGGLDAPADPTNPSGSTGGNGPFRGGSNSARTETVYSAFTLRRLGLHAGPITSLSYFVSSKYSTDTYTGFTLALGHSPDSTLSGSFSSGLPTVYTGDVTLPATGQQLQLVFNGAAFSWDGTSSLLVQTCFNKTTTSSDDLVSIERVPNTRLFTSGAGSVCAATSGTLSQVRPRLGFTQPGLSYTLPAQAGMAGQVLTQQANGSVTFQTPAWTQSGSSLYPSVLSSQVGIGTATPAAPLEVQGGSVLTSSGAAGASTQLRLSRPSASGIYPASAELGLGRYAAGLAAYSQLDFTLGNGSSALANQTVLSLLGDGRVGIGTSSPLGRLHLLNSAGTGALDDYLFDEYGPGDQGLFMRRANGTPAAATNLADGDFIGQLTFVPQYNGGLGYGGSSVMGYYRGSGTTLLTDLRFVTSGTERLRLDPSGNLGLGTSAPRGHFDVDGPGDTYLVDDPNVGSGQSVFLPGHLLLAPYNASTPAAYVQARIPNPNGGTNLSLILRTTYQGTLRDALTLNPNGSAAFFGTVTANGVTLTSDARFKQQVRPLQSALAGLLRLRGVRYQWNGLGVQHGGTAGQEQIGLLAQEVELVYPELVHTDAQGYKSVNYAQLTPVLLEAIRELQAQLDAQRSRATRAEAAQQADHAALLTLQEQVAHLQQVLLPAAQAPQPSPAK